jgi:hypothetical protein
MSLSNARNLATPTSSVMHVSLVEPNPRNRTRGRSQPYDTAVPHEEAKELNHEQTQR